MSAPLIAGIDGCKGVWWAVVLAPADHLGAASFRRVETLEEVFVGLGVAMALIDMPIGLVDGPELRAVEPALRRALPGKASSVFSTPCRAALAAAEYPAACAVNRAALGRGLSKQSFALFPKIRAAEAAALKFGPERLREGHPEMSFALMKGAPVLAKKRRPEGQSARQALLEREGLPTAALLAARPAGCGVDDLLDAAALLWSAARFHRRAHQLFPGVPGTDALGLPMAVIA